MGTLASISLKVIALYFIIIIIFKLMGKREIGELGLVDFVVFVMIAEMAALSIEKHVDTFVQSLYPIILLTIIQIVFSLISLKSRRFRRIIDGEPAIIIKNGKILEKQMKKQRYNFDDLLMQLRQKDVRDIADVEYALLEPTGKLSIIKKENNKHGFTIPLILDGQIQYDKLKGINKDEQWLMKILKEKGIKNSKEVSFCSITGDKIYVDLFE